MLLIQFSKGRHTSPTPNLEISSKVGSTHATVFHLSLVVRPYGLRVPFFLFLFFLLLATLLAAGDICIISEKLRFVIYLVPKAASTSVSTLALTKELGGRKYLNCHLPSTRDLVCRVPLCFIMLRYLNRFYPLECISIIWLVQIRDDFTRAAFVRDPLDRFISAYHFVYTLNPSEQLREVRIIPAYFICQRFSAHQRALIYLAIALPYFIHKFKGDRAFQRFASVVAKADSNDWKVDNYHFRTQVISACHSLLS